MEVVYDQVADNWGRDEARKGQDVGEGVDVFVGREEGGERGRSVDPVSGEHAGGYKVSLCTMRHG